MFYKTLKHMIERGQEGLIEKIEIFKTRKFTQEKHDELINMLGVE